MNGHTAVDIAGLRALAASIRSVAHDLSAAGVALRDVDATALGSAELDEAAAEFHTRWDHGVGQLAHVTDDMAQRLSSTADLYEQTEQGNTTPLGGS
jgi:uncharacterized protein YukE